MNDCVLFFVKYPEPGEVKTRLAENSSPELAAEFYATFVEEKFEELLSGCKAKIIVCFAPETAGQAMRDWLGEYHRYVGQKGADLGRRMENGFREAFFMKYERVVLAGSDVPGLSPAIIEEALEALTPDTACLGPADDGGYYLIGFHRKGFVPEVFRNIDWSTERVFEQTASLISGQGMKTHILPNLEDMDTLEDVETLIALGSAGPLGTRSIAEARRLLGR
ncbi:DUF2064 domain-containing protein [Pseudodesulfovibrio cashew]|uniref:DUF2064 domain-containing protein n=1 Tax=Pseudodesulfovibrio cashew TaxID=2678688 RepID=A0A6I6JIE6_9BACT|nr:TIGR04282 family arsenosugar biosynthesis glycosyltransferase [Pseudodesulfovibrio cashew]QGY40173.1 DUF2064 domain-containing protein [Pseudodesulfovibrio cashew]